MTEDARDVKDGKRAAVLYSATQHAREWIVDRGQPAPDALTYIDGWNHGDKK